ncbi:NUDIX hydrolase [Dictyobacter alpinus]|nr:NUDIX hydrolase [Dictyobacter alpinus]
MGGRLPPFGSAAVIVEDDGRYLVIELPRKRLAFPGGFMNWRENPQQAAEREGKEETGLTVKAENLVGFYSCPSTAWWNMSNLSFVFEARITGGQLRKNMEGNPRWVTETELRQRLDAYTLGIFEDYQEYRERKKNTHAA